MFKREIIVGVNLSGYQKTGIPDLIDALGRLYDLFPRVIKFRILGKKDDLDLFCPTENLDIYTKIESKEIDDRKLYEINNNFHEGVLNCLFDAIQSNSNIILTPDIDGLTSKFISSVMADQYEKMGYTFYDLPVFQVIPTKIGDTVICGVSNFYELTQEKFEHYLDMASHASQYVRGVVCPRVGIIDLFSQLNVSFDAQDDPSFIYKGKVSGYDLVEGNVDVVVVPMEISNFLVDLAVGTGSGAIHLLNDLLNDITFGSVIRYFGDKSFKFLEDYYSRSYSTNSIMWSGINNSVIAVHKPNISSDNLLDVGMFCMQIYGYARLINKQ